MLTDTKNLNRQPFGKSLAHHEIQCYLKKQIDVLELEKKIGGRRADCVWEDSKIVFEIQISPISLNEVQNRIDDYSKQGYQVVWILHDQVFNVRTVSRAEKFLRHFCATYYCNGGCIYDQLEVVQGERRIYKGEPLVIDLRQPFVPFLKVPLRKWSLHFVGDLHTFCCQQGEQEVKRLLKPHLLNQGFKWWLSFIGFRLLEAVCRTPS